MNTRTLNINNILDNLHINESISKDLTVTGKNYNELVKNLKKNGFELESSDANSIKLKSVNGVKVTLYDDNNSEYTGMFNRYSDGGVEIIYIKRV